MADAAEWMAEKLKQPVDQAVGAYETFLADVGKMLKKKPKKDKK
jgi:hypothetical protein